MNFTYSTGTRLGKLPSARYVPYQHLASLRLPVLYEYKVHAIVHSYSNDTYTQVFHHLTISMRLLNIYSTIETRKFKHIGSTPCSK